MSALAAWTLRDEIPKDIIAIHALTRAAFLHAPHRSGTEQFIIDALRRAGDLSASVVAESEGVIIGHAATSSITIHGNDLRWHGLGPISVSPRNQSKGIGQQLVDAALARLRAQGAAGCVVLGDPAYYARFGFQPWPQLRLPGVSADYFQSLAFGDAMPTGDVAYAPGFAATA